MLSVVDLSGIFMMHPTPNADDKGTEPFWRTTSLDEMSDAQWESLCDGCGRCCLVKLEDEDDGEIYVTDIACKLLDHDTCRCRDYGDRHAQVPDCIKLDPAAARGLSWLPPSCAYRLVAEAKDLYWWHPLVSGDPDSIHVAGISVRGRIGATEDKIPLEEYPFYIVQWPMQIPTDGSGQQSND
jgi:uncharacterized protein